MATGTGAVDLERKKVAMIKQAEEERELLFPDGMLVEMPSVQQRVQQWEAVGGSPRQHPRIHHRIRRADPNRPATASTTKPAPTHHTDALRRRERPMLDKRKLFDD